MIRVQHIIFPGILLGSLLIIFITNMITTPHIALANNPVSVNTVTEAAARGFSRDCSLSMNYSESIRQWCGLIEKYAGENGLSPSLIAAVIQQESGGNPLAYSGSGAVGLMQIMARDGIAAGFMCGGGPCFSNRPSIQELYDPEFNISYGARMLSGLKNKFEGDIREALRVYGPMDVGYSYADTVMQINNN